MFTSDLKQGFTIHHADSESHANLGLSLDYKAPTWQVIFICKLLLLRSVTNITPSGQHLQLFNPKPKAEGIFYLFPQLPIEIRCMIWEQELHHERLICVELASHEAHPEYLRQVSPWLQSDEDYLIISEWPAINKTLHINAESRSYASRFYRVQLPCRYRCDQDGRVEEKGIFYFNPELDTLEIKGMQCFAKFAHDLWRHDPRRAGLLRMVIDISFPRGFRSYADVEDKAPLRKGLSRLKHVIFMDQGDKGRMYFRWFHIGWKFHRSRPIMAAASSFQRLPDPRPIKADLKQLHIGMIEPRRMIHSWLRMMAALGVQPEFEYRFMITYGGARDQIYSRDDAERYIQEEDSNGEKNQRAVGLLYHQGPSRYRRCRRRLTKNQTKHLSRR
ncbi:hypothetical protein BHE90_002517 [Fusarium euwallaceae]|uniref:2EXR domain-containing protein n=1 Tax=Fusarium euwallaceae TaxID=1147111 RepID=A0A430M4L9_9HYPO|nr:hypothetical protein BHE90_002517 [Fusarium euwallaceae]